VKRYRVVIYEAADGYRWRMLPAGGGHTVAAASESFTRKSSAKRNAASSTGARFERGVDVAVVEVAA
jgi:uncharacterized protein YegP (UPF0339 family)